MTTQNAIVTKPTYRYSAVQVLDDHTSSTAAAEHRLDRRANGTAEIPSGRVVGN